jgi:hypothetical protein
MASSAARAVRQRPCASSPRFPAKSARKTATSATRSYIVCRDAPKIARLPSAMTSGGICIAQASGAGSCSCVTMITSTLLRQATPTFSCHRRRSASPSAGPPSAR